MYEVELTQKIDAPASCVWDVITAFRDYDEWNPVITRMRGTLAAGAPMSFVIAVGGRELKIGAKMLRVEAGAELRWAGPTSWVVARFFEGEHFLRVEPNGASASNLVHGESFKGLLLPLLWKKLRIDLEEAYGTMNRAVKARAESLKQGPRAA